MKQRTSFLTRCVALALALVLLVSNVNLGVALKANAAGNTVSEAEIVANNYDLSAAEKALLESGYLKSGTVSYTVPTAEDGLVSVDTENAKIIAKNGKDGWVATAAVIAYGDKELAVELVNGEASYDPNVVGNAFSVKVTYSLDVDVDNQEALLNAMADLKQGVKNLADAYVADTNLGTVVLAMDTLVELADGINMNFGTFSLTAQFEPEAAAAIKAMAAEVQANGDRLDLQVANAAYNSSASKVGYLLNDGDEYKDVLVETYKNLNAIKNDPLSNNNLLDGYLQSTDVASYTQWMAFKKILSNLVADLEPAANADWSAAGQADTLLGKAATAELDNLVAALGDLTSVTIKNPLNVAATEIQANLAMWNVAVKVVLYTVNDENVVVEYGSESTVLTLAENATAEEILAAVEESGIEALAIANWDEAYVEGKFEKSADSLPDALNKDIEYVITYSPRSYKVTDWDGVVTDALYGTKIELPAHEDETQSYDYKVNGEAYAQGETITVEDNTVITRSSGKAYTTTDLYTIVADNYGDEIAKTILTSGALLNNEIINVRKPDPTDEGLLKLVDGTLTAEATYAASYQNKNWVPYTYGENGTENAFSGNTAAWNGKSVKVQYILKLDNYTQSEVQAVLDLADALKAEADAQTSTLNTLAAYHDQMGQLDKTKLGALNGVIDVTDFTPGDGVDGTDDDTDAKNQELRAYFKSMVGGIIANNLDGNNYLKIYNILGKYNDEGLKYYYENSDAVINEINSLSGYLTGMLADDEKIAALEIMVAAAGYPEYAEKIADLEQKMAAAKAALTAPNAAIDLNSSNLGKLASALSVKGEVDCEASGVPYLLSENLTALDESQVMVQVIITAGNKSATVTSGEMDRGHVLTQADIDELQGKLDEEVDNLLGENEPYYNLTVEGSELADLVGTEMNATVNTYYTYSVKEYTVKIEGEADQIVTVEDLEINLPTHPTQGFIYEYTVDGVVKTTSTYTFAREQLSRLFVNGEYTITRIEINEAAEKIEETFNEWLVKDANGNVIGLHAKVAGTQQGIMDFVMTIVESGYSYIGLNGEDLLYMNADTLEISLQTLINAILNDEQFNNDAVIALGEYGKGEVAHASMQLGNDKNDIHYNDLNFVLELTSVPAQLTNKVETLKTVSDYLKFQSNNGVLDVAVNLPDQVYGAYAAALIATGNVDKSDVNELDQAVALQFLYDYLTAITGSEMDMVTFTNTLKMMGIDKDLTGYNNYYNKGVSAYKNYVDVAISAGGAAIDIAAPAQKAINALIDFSGVDISAYETYLGMIKEYKDANAELTASANATLANIDKEYLALIVDAQADDLTNKFEAPSSYDALSAEAAGLAGYSAVILLNDVNGNLYFGGTTVLDLNGKDVEGTISGENLYIIDSSMDTYNAGSAYGVSGNAVVFGGNYYSNVTDYLKDGYYMDGDTVRNALYYITDVDGTVTFVINGDVYESEYGIPNAKALAIDIAADLVLNYATSASLSVAGNELIGIDVEDLVGLYAGDTVNGLVKALLEDVTVGKAGYENNEGFEAVVNLILKDILDLAAISDALANNTALATYEVTTEPWQIEIDHVADGNYATVNVASNADLTKTFNVALVLESQYNDNLAALTAKLAEIVVADETEVLVDIPQPTYSDKQLNVVGKGKATVVVDMSANNDYATMIGVILAYGNPDKAEAVAEAINNGDMDALKVVIDNTSVKEVFTALKKLSRNVNFAAMAQAVGVTNLGGAAELEAVYHVALCAAGKALEELEITGMDSKLGALYNEETGYYELTKENIFRDKEISARGYSALIELTADELTLKVKLFADECTRRDPNHDGVVDILDLIYLRKILAEADPEVIICEYCADVNEDGAIDILDVIALRQQLAEAE